MVSLLTSPMVACRRVGAIALLFVSACQTAPPVNVDAKFTAAPALSAPDDRKTAVVAVLPVEDGTPNAGAARLLVMMRQELERQLIDRLYSPLTSQTVDAALRGAGKPVATESLLAPANLQKMAGHAHEDAVFALRIVRWDDSRIATTHRVNFQFEAAMMGRDGVPLWNGTIQGDVKAGGAGAAPLDNDGKARSCASLAITEMLQRLPRRTVR